MNPHTSETSKSEVPVDPITHLQEVLKVVRSVDPEMPAQTLQSLLYIHTHPGCSQTELAGVLEVQTSTVARIAARLSEWRAYKQRGLNFITNEVNPRDRRERQLWLTRHGQAFINELIAAMG